MSNQPTVHIAVGGQGTRIREGMETWGFPAGFPKQLLPTGTGETLLGRIVRQIDQIGHAAIHASYDNVRAIGENNDIGPDVSLLIARNSNGPLGPLIKEILRTKERTLSCAGDFWADFSWEDFLDFHESRDTPVSILIAPSVPTFDGARFRVDDNGVVQSWGRVDETTSEDLINIGAYIVEPERLVIKKLRELSWHKEDPFNDTMIEDGLMSAYVLDSTAFNVNNPQVYAALVQHTAP